MKKLILVLRHKNRNWLPFVARQSRCKHRFTLAAPSVLSLNIIYYNLSEVHKSLMYGDISVRISFFIYFNLQ